MRQDSNTIHDLPLRQLLAAFLCSCVIVLAAWQIIRRMQAEHALSMGSGPEAAEAAAALDPTNDIYPIVLAQRREELGQTSLPQWLQAIAINPRRALSLTQTAIAAEFAARPDLAESLFLQAERFNKLWLPRWSLLNFYSRHNRPNELLHWARLALDRAYGDRTPLFQLCLQAGASPKQILSEIIGNDPRNLSSLVYFLAAQNDLSSLEAASARLLASAVGAGGSIPAESADAVAVAINAFLRAGQSEPAVRLWNQLSASRLIPYAAWSAQSPLTNPGLMPPLTNGALDWHIPANEGIQALRGVPVSGIKFAFSGRQAESAVLLNQTVLLPGGRSWRLSFEYQTRNIAETQAGLVWSLNPLSGDLPTPPTTAPPLLSADSWTAVSQVWTLPPGTRLYRLSLDVRRSLGQTRPEGEAWFRSLGLREVQP